MRPGTRLIKSAISSKHSLDLATNLGEVALDSLLTPGLLREIPVIGTAISLVKAGNDVAAYFFAKKIAVFLNEVESVPPDEREAFFREKCGNKDAETLGETTLLLLEKTDNLILAKCLGRAFALLVSGQISRESFEIYAFTIRDLNPYLLRQLRQIYANEGIMVVDAPAAVQLSNYGLMEVTTLTTLTNSRTMQRGYEKTSYGKHFFDSVIAPVMEE